MADYGHKTLLIDADPQANSTSGVGIIQSKLTHSLYDSVVETATLAEVLCPSPFENLHVLPADQNLASIDLDLGKLARREFRLKEVLEALHPFYQVMIIDCPPAINLMTVNAMVAATHTLIPVQCEYFALEGLAYLTQTQTRIKENFNPELALLGVLPTLYDARTSLNRQVLANMQDVFGEAVFDPIPRNIRLSEAPSHGLPIQLYAAHSKGAQAYKDLALAIKKRLPL